ncbi:MAG: DUF362 domain-containing protein [Thermodesulfobacteriota bacterium]
MHKVLIHPAEYANIQPAVQKAFEAFQPDLKGKSVLLKPNVLRASKPEEGITTHPALLAAVLEQVESLGPARIVVGDNPGLMDYGANEKSFQSSGLLEVAGKYYQNLGESSCKMEFNPDFLPEVSVSSQVLQADYIISLPKFKTHGLTVLTGAIKNSYGILPGALKAQLHKAAGSPERFHQAVVDVFRLRIPDLFIMDAVLGMEGNGPASKDLRHIGLVLASDNAVALDGVMAYMMGLDPGRLPFLQRAKELGLGEFESGKLECLGELQVLPDYKIPPLGGEATLQDPGVQDLIQRRVSVKPQVDESLCTSCGSCVEQCPADALHMEQELPQVVVDSCIACFCCQEICPEKAIALS